MNFSFQSAVFILLALLWLLRGKSKCLPRLLRPHVSRDEPWLPYVFRDKVDLTRVRDEYSTIKKPMALVSSVEFAASWNPVRVRTIWLKTTGASPCFKEVFGKQSHGLRSASRDEITRIPLKLDISHLTAPPTPTSPLASILFAFKKATFQTRIYCKDQQELISISLVSHCVCLLIGWAYWRPIIFFTHKPLQSFKMMIRPIQEEWSFDQYWLLSSDHTVRDQINRKIGYCISSQTNTATLRNFESFLGTSLGRTCLETMTLQIIAERKFYDLSIYFSIFSI